MPVPDDPAPGAYFGQFAIGLLEDAPCGVAVTDEDGTFVVVNRTLAEWLNRPKPEIVGQARIQDLLAGPGRIYFETHIAPMLHLQGFVREIACQFERPGSAPLPVLLNGVRRPSPDGTTARIEYFVFDATERTRYERTLREMRNEAEQLAAIVSSSPNAILRVAADGSILRWNRGAERMFGLTAADAAGRTVQDVIVLKDRADWFRRLAETEREDEYRFEAVLESGEDLDITVARIGHDTMSPGDADYSVILRDISTRARAERHLKLMVGELNHRVKNTIAVIVSIAKQTLPRNDEEGLTEKFTRRLIALARSHDILTARRWESAGLKEILSIVCDEAGGPDRVTIDGPNLELTPRQTTALSMALHELVTNALKYGALSAEDGSVSIDWTVSPGAPEQVCFVWQERGGPPVRPPDHAGFGTRMIEEVLAMQFDGEVAMEFRPEGLLCRLQFAYTAPDPRSDNEGDVYRL